MVIVAIALGVVVGALALPRGRPCWLLTVAVVALQEPCGHFSAGAGLATASGLRELAASGLFSAGARFLPQPAGYDCLRPQVVLLLVHHGRSQVFRA